ncbi:hypothetical protein JKF63_04330 [Porcisia hertigi]|uniref:Battenin n=1 Tax=Porcisia hertigi TaxID=2761500 RepID=A0A836I4H5_9TRYP|nr:hypothetical protein JKF63_04330 [Porcisia hertigi]
MADVDKKSGPGLAEVEMGSTTLEGSTTKREEKAAVVGGLLEQTPAANGEEGERYIRDLKTLDRLFKSTVVRNSFFLWMVGFINNFHYCLINSAASDLAKFYGLKNLMPLIVMANVVFGIFARIVNMCIATRVSYNVRITAMTVASVLGILLVSFASQLGNHHNELSFTVMLIGVVFLGTASNYGECVVLTFLQRYPNSIVGAWSSGTGISGVAAALILLGLSSANLTDQETFLATLPLCIVYWLCFTVGMVSPHKVLVATLASGKKKDIVIHFLDGDDEEKISMLREKTLARDDVVSVTDDYEIKMIMNLLGVSWRRSPVIPMPELDAEEVEPEDDSYHPRCCGLFSRNNGVCRWWRRNGPDLVLMHKAMLWFFFNLAVVYVAEYAAQLMADFSFYCEEGWNNNFWLRKSYVVCQFCYQLGVLISRSSLLIVKIPYVGVISIIQVINALGWIIQANVLYIKGHTRDRQVGMSFLLFGWMFFIGLMGGASYVNVFYLILKRSTKMREREERQTVCAYLESKGHDVSNLEDAEGHSRTEGHSCDAGAERFHEQSNPSYSGKKEPTRPKSRDLSDSLHGHLKGMDLTKEELDEITAIHRNLNDVWTGRREAGMNIGALYATIGITIGTVIDLILTNTVVKGGHKC